MPAYPGPIPSLEMLAAEIREMQATVHERVLCPECRAPVGRRCVSMITGGWWREPGPGVAEHPHTLKHPHARRLRAAGIYAR